MGAYLVQLRLIDSPVLPVVLFYGPFHTVNCCQLILKDKTFDSALDKLADKATMIHMKVSHYDPGYPLKVAPDALHVSRIFEQGTWPSCIKGQQLFIGGAFCEKAVCIVVPEAKHRSPTTQIEPPVQQNNETISCTVV